MHGTTTTTGPTVPAHPLPSRSAPGPSGNGGRNGGAASVADRRYHDRAVAVTQPEDPRTVRERMGWQLSGARVLAGLLTQAMCLFAVPACTGPARAGCVGLDDP